jgi:hypothetical protein
MGVVRPRWALAATAVVVALAAATLTPASAATLSVQGSGIVTDSAFACTDAVLPTTTAVGGPGQTTVRVGSVPPECVDRTMNVWLLTSSGALVSSGQLAPTVEGQNTVTVTTPFNTASVASVVVTIDGWWIGTTWTAPAPAVSCQSYNANGTPNAAPCVLTVLTHASFVNNGYRYTNFQFSAVTTAPVWQITVDLSSTTAGFTGMAPVRFVGTYQNVVRAPGYTCTSLPIFVGREANPQWNSPNGELVFTNDPAFTAGTTLCDV